MKIRILAMALAFVAPSGAQSEVRSSSASGFELQSTATVKASPADTYAMLGRIGEWWSPSHSYSGKAANLSLTLGAGGCFCERLDDGGAVEHMRVVQARPAKLLRLQGGLGPLQGEGVSGTLTWTLKAVPGGTEITQNYIVGGYFRSGGDKLAGPVGQVLEEQLGRLKARLER
jgi:uncharacterized protein YndB with AHSA1/START domain